MLTLEPSVDTKVNALEIMVAIGVQLAAAISYPFDIMRTWLLFTKKKL